jgi:hypothetical protein
MRMEVTKWSVPAITNLVATSYAVATRMDVIRIARYTATDRTTE